MEDRSFRTAVMGGFRKKDVIRYLAEEKQQQDSALEAYRQQLEEAEKQLSEMLQERDCRTARLDEALAQEEQLNARLRQAEQARDDALVEMQLANAQLTELRARTEQAENQNAAARQELSNRIAQLRQLLAEAEAREKAVPTCEPADIGEIDRLQMELIREQQKTARLENRVRQLENAAEPQENTDQLWNLCGKMERTIRQMEQMLDGPYRMTCYPDDSWKSGPRQEAPAVEEAELPSEEPVARPRRPAAKAPSVSSLLQRVRRK